MNNKNDSIIKKSDLKGDVFYILCLARCNIKIALILSFVKKKKKLENMLLKIVKLANLLILKVIFNRKLIIISFKSKMLKKRKRKKSIASCYIQISLFHQKFAVIWSKKN